MKVIIFLLFLFKPPSPQLNVRTGIEYSNCFQRHSVSILNIIKGREGVNGVKFQKSTNFFQEL